MELSPEQLKRFWSKVDRKGADQCWIWLGAKKKRGYGNIQFDKKMYQAHVVSWAIANHRYPKLFVLHLCDNPSCVNPDHLVEGTHCENMEDMRLKGRSAKKLNEEKVRHIRRSSDTNAQLSRRYHVSNQVISQIRRGLIWKHIQ